MLSFDQAFTAFFFPGKKAGLVSACLAPTLPPRLRQHNFAQNYGVKQDRLKITWPSNSFIGTTVRSKICSLNNQNCSKG